MAKQQARTKRMMDARNALLGDAFEHALATHPEWARHAAATIGASIGFAEALRSITGFEPEGETVEHYLESKLEAAFPQPEDTSGYVNTLVVTIDGRTDASASSHERFINAARALYEHAPEGIAKIAAEDSARTRNTARWLHGEQQLPEGAGRNPVSIGPDAGVGPWLTLQGRSVVDLGAMLRKLIDLCDIEPPGCPQITVSVERELAGTTRGDGCRSETADPGAC